MWRTIVYVGLGKWHPIIWSSVILNDLFCFWLFDFGWAKRKLEITLGLNSISLVHTVVVIILHKAYSMLLPLLVLWHKYGFILVLQLRAQHAQGISWKDRVFTGKMSFVGYAPILFFIIVITTLMFITTILHGRQFDMVCWIFLNLF